jgi:hypothetical protein
MTLIITSLRPRDIVITSDSRATLETAGKITGFDDNYQKIFPMPHHPLVISHHGQNTLDHKTLPVFMDGFMSQLNAGDLTILEVADQFRTYAHDAIRRCLQGLGTIKTGCGFLFAGFGADDRGPAVVELFWKRQDNALITEERNWHPTAIVTSGDGKTQIDKVGWHQIADVPVEKVCNLHEQLLDQAIHAKVDPNSVGGPIQEIVVKREKWEWVKPPQIAGATTKPN